MQNNINKINRNYNVRKMNYPSFHNNNSNSQEESEKKLKCGEIYINKNKQNEMFLLCTICEYQYTSLDIFSKHYFNEHLVNNSETSELNNFKIEIGDNEALTKQSFDEQIFGTGNDDINECKYDVLPESSLENCVDPVVFVENQASLISQKQKAKKVKPDKKIRKKLPEGYFKCKICSELLKVEEKVEHSKRHQHSKRFMCEICGKGCKSNYQLQRHMRNHTGERPYKCQFCSATFNCKHAVKCHERTHLDYKPFKCSICGMSLKSKKAAERHELRHSEPVEANFECDLCGKKFNTHTKMIEHRGRHKEENKPFQCPKCPKSFQTKYACTAHDRLEHIGEYNYKCSFCDKLFIKNSKKKSHEVTHTRVGQPFPCNLCTKRYATREGLYKHTKRDHISNKPSPDYKCHKCEKNFKLQSEYAEHCRKHTLEEYQFICSVCGANFVNEINLKNHLNIIHKIEDIKLK